MSENLSGKVSQLAVETAGMSSVTVLGSARQWYDSLDTLVWPLLTISAPCAGVICVLARQSIARSSVLIFPAPSRLQLK